MRKRTQSAIDKAWKEVDALIAKWDAEGYPENETDEIADPPTLSDAHYIDVQQLMKYRSKNAESVV